MDDTPAPTAELEENGAAIAKVEQHAAAAKFEAETYALISTDDDYAKAGEFLTETLKPALREIELTWRPMQKKTDAAHKEVCEQRRRHEDPLLAAEVTVKAAMLTYHLAQEKIESEAEAVRLEEARRAAEDIKVAEAARLERDGHQEAAEERLEEPVAPVIATPAPRRAAPKAAGTSVRKRWDFEIDDAALIDRKFLKPDLQKIRGTVTSMGPDAATLVGGITVIERKGMAARAR